MDEECVLVHPCCAQYGCLEPLHRETRDLWDEICANALCARRTEVECPPCPAYTAAVCIEGACVAR